MSKLSQAIVIAGMKFAASTGTVPTRVYLGQQTWRELKYQLKDFVYSEHPKIHSLQVYLVTDEHHLTVC